MTRTSLTALALVWALSTIAASPGFTQPMTTVAKSTASNPADLPNDAPDPRGFLDEIDGEAAMAWVHAHNAASLAQLGQNPLFEQYRTEALKILEATDRVPAPNFATGGFVDNFWQDKDHVQGLWRRTNWDAYKSGQPDWQTILDIDALAKADGKTWVYGGSSCLPPANTRCLISLSDGGTDADEIREFDVTTKSFVKDGFFLPAGKQNASWRDADTIYVSREFTPGELTESGYAYVTKVLKRGQTLDQAVEIHRGEKTDVSAGRYPVRDITGAYVADASYRYLDYYHSQYSFHDGDRTVTFPLPTTSSFSALHEGQIVWWLKEDWTSASGRTFTSGSVIAFDFKQGMANPTAIEPALLFQPSAHESVEGISQTRNRLILTLSANVVGEIRAYSLKDGQWSSIRIELPENSTLSVGSADDESDRVFAWSSGFLQPSTLYLADAATGKVEKLRTAPSRFNAEGLQVQQHWATSKDGTRVPYFLVARKDIKLDGTTPTLLYAYGGFEVSMQPSYSGSLGKLWLEQGGAYALANIRGGGEFGPKWHEAGMKTNRQRIYDDFAAVGEDLIARKVTTPEHLGIMGGSNGGLLMGVQLTQRPDLWNAVVVQVPLLDMVNYTRMSAGASWQGEYGNPDDPVEGAFLRSISPYHNVKAGVAYPEPLFETSTKDDRVGPVHARKMAALFEDMSLPFYYYENTEGGHNAAANLQETARRYAIEYTYLAEKLMKK
nr:prolyl oligopeptidase family serine peptidase [Asticcacaulis biprosthecium]